MPAENPGRLSGIGRFAGLLRVALLAGFWDCHLLAGSSGRRSDARGRRSGCGWLRLSVSPGDADGHVLEALLLGQGGRVPLGHAMRKTRRRTSELLLYRCADLAVSRLIGAIYSGHPNVEREKFGWLPRAAPFFRHRLFPSNFPLTRTAFSSPANQGAVQSPESHLQPDPPSAPSNR